MKFEEIGPGISEKSFKGVDRRRMDNGPQQTTKLGFDLLCKLSSNNLYATWLKVQQFEIFCAPKNRDRMQTSVCQAYPLKFRKNL